MEERSHLPLVFAGETCLWLYTEGQSSLLYFNRLVQDPKGTDLLYWTEET